jgi:hypothetical protein
MIRFWVWLDGLLPCRCYSCGEWKQRRHMLWVESFVAGHVWVCKRCGRNWFGG